jgi:L-lactate dehydrogenase complex protein LldG
MTSRDKILHKLRANRPFEDAPPRPRIYAPVTEIESTTPDALLARFTLEMERLKGEVFVADGDAAACATVLELLQAHSATRAIAWDFGCIPVAGLEAAVRGAGVEVIHPNTHQAEREGRRAALLAASETAQVSLTGVDAAVAATATLIVTTAPGKGRIPTVLAPVHIAIVRQEQIIPRLENWVASLRARGIDSIRQSANVCFITGPSRTGDIEMELILGVHGPGRVQAVVVR